MQGGKITRGGKKTRQQKNTISTVIQYKNNSIENAGTVDSA